ncbi:MAG: 4a-hydroxytetrahydrobiopterin dehydratase [Gammaproteobacteria bacterium]|nr:4a-hydroxytetrahydrobiopterin dehydratase [Gammaproteobacteria bacterium]
MTALVDRPCRPRKGGADRLDRTSTNDLLRQIEGWHTNDDATEINRNFDFKNYYETMAFVNALAWIAHRDDHHPDIEVSYKTCRVRFTTHSVQGLSENDFICAAKIGALVD